MIEIKIKYTDLWFIRKVSVIDGSGNKHNQMIFDLFKYYRFTLILRQLMKTQYSSPYLETEDGEHYNSCKHRRETVSQGNKDSVSAAVVVFRIVT